VTGLVLDVVAGHHDYGYISDMKINDIRKLKPEEQDGLRKKLIDLYESGLSNKEISKQTGYCYSHVSTLVQRYKKGNLDVTVSDSKAIGRRRGKHRKLTCDQEEQLKELLVATTPYKLAYPSGLWSKKNIRLVVEQEFGVPLSPRTITDYLKRWKITPTCPTDGKENKTVVKRWRESVYPDIEAQAKEKRAVIHWCNYVDLVRKTEDVFPPAADSSTIDADCGITGIKMLSTVTNRGDKHFMLFREPTSPYIFRSFIRALIHKKKNKILLIVGRDKIFKTYRDTCASKSKIELFDLPFRLMNS